MTVRARLGTPRLIIFLVLLPVLIRSVTVLGQSADYEVTWSTLDGGGSVANGGIYEVTGTIAQPDAGHSNGGTYSLTGGFWPLPQGPAIFSDGFESGDLTVWSNVIPKGTGHRARGSETPNHVPREHQGDLNTFIDELLSSTDQMRALGQQTGDEGSRVRDACPPSR